MHHVVIMQGQLKAFFLWSKATDYLHFMEQRALIKGANANSEMQRTNFYCHKKFEMSVTVM